VKLCIIAAPVFCRFVLYFIRPIVRRHIISPSGQIETNQKLFNGPQSWFKKLSYSGALSINRYSLLVALLTGVLWGDILKFCHYNALNGPIRVSQLNLSAVSPLLREKTA
jgi:hypothetical protein